MFLPQLLLFSLIIIIYSVNNLAMCLLLQTIVFVSYNKVITAQYFTWFICLIPIVNFKFKNINILIVIIVFIVWIISILLWLFNAYQLEFLGKNNFLLIWYSSLLFHIVNTIVIALLIIYC